MSLVFNNLLALFQHYRPIKFVEKSSPGDAEGKRSDEENAVATASETSVLEVAKKDLNSPGRMDMKTAILIPLFWSIPLAALGWGVYACFLKIIKLH